MIFIFTCVKNGRKYIERLFDSILNQTCTDFTYFIYEDGSDDSIYDLVVQLKNKVSRLPKPFKIIYEHNPINIGVNLSTKHCISKVDCPYFMWMNCDDFLDKNFIKNATQKIRKNPNYFIYRTNIQYINDDLTLHGKSFYNDASHKLINKSDQTFNYFLSGPWRGNHCIINTSIYFKVNPNNYFVENRAFFNDVQLNLLALGSKEKWFFINKSKSFYLLRDESESHKIFLDTKTTDSCAIELFSNTTLKDFIPEYIYLNNLNYLFNKFNISFAKKEYKDANKWLHIFKTELKSHHLSIKNIPYKTRFIIKVFFLKLFS